jgi:hypothetical protein
MPNFSALSDAAYDLVLFRYSFVIFLRYQVWLKGAFFLIFNFSCTLVNLLSDFRLQSLRGLPVFLTFVEFNLLLRCCNCALGIYVQMRCGGWMYFRFVVTGFFLLQMYDPLFIELFDINVQWVVRVVWKLGLIFTIRSCFFFKLVFGIDSMSIVLISR